MLTWFRDAFAGGFLSGIVEGKSLEECVDRGQWLAALGLRELGPSYVIFSHHASHATGPTYVLSKNGYSRFDICNSTFRPVQVILCLKALIADTNSQLPLPKEELHLICQVVLERCRRVTFQRGVTDFNNWQAFGRGKIPVEMSGEMYE